MYYFFRKKSQRGFAVGAILFALGMVGVLGGTLFSGYSQILASGKEVSENIVVKTDIRSAYDVLKSQAILGTDGLTVCLPRLEVGSAVCDAAPIKLENPSLADSGRLAAPNPSLGTAEAGILKVGSVSQILDPWGHNFFVCRWENLKSSPAAPALGIISSGANNVFETNCEDSSASGDDVFIKQPVGAVFADTSQWADDDDGISFGNGSVTIDPDGTITANNLIANAATLTNLYLTDPLAVSYGGTGASTAGSARLNLGSGVLGDALFVSTTATAARTTLGASSLGDLIFTATDAPAARASLGSGVLGDAFFQVDNRAGALALLGLTGTMVIIDGDITGTAGSVPASGITGQILGTQILDGTINAVDLADSGVVAGIYSWGTVNTKGLVTAANDILSGGGVLGASATNTSPHAVDDLTTGFYSTASGTLSAASNGINIFSTTNTGSIIFSGDASSNVSITTPLLISSASLLIKSADGSYNGSDLTLTTGNGGTTSGSGGDLLITTGSPIRGAGGKITIKPAGAATTVTEDCDGSGVWIQGGNGISQGEGGRLVLLGGLPGSNGDGGEVYISSGYAIGTGHGGALTISSGNSTGGGPLEAGLLTIQGGHANGNGGKGASIHILAGYGNRDTNQGGSLLIQSGTGGIGGGAGGALTIAGGTGGATNGAAGKTSIYGGYGGATNGDGGDLLLSGGLPVEGNGADVYLEGSDGVGSDRDGGNVVIKAGEATGTGKDGYILFDGLVGIGSSIPTLFNDSPSLTMLGEFKLGSISSICSSSTEGHVAYDYTTHKPAYCNGTSWVPM